MRFKCGRTQTEIDAIKSEREVLRRRLKEWHVFTPWWPRTVAKGDCRMFEPIERRLVNYYKTDYASEDKWEYRAIGATHVMEGGSVFRYTDNPHMEAIVFVAVAFISVVIGVVVEVMT